MSDSIDVNVPATNATIKSGYSNGWYGITDKDRMALDQDALNSALRSLVTDVAATSIAVEKTGAASVLATQTAASASELATEKTASAIQLANSLAFANTQNLLIGGFKDGRFDAANYGAAAALAAANNTAAIQLFAAQNTAAIQAAAAECCCEIKTLIIADGQKTRDLVNNLQDLNLAVQLQDAKTEIAVLKTKPSSTSTSA